MASKYRWRDLLVADLDAVSSGDRASMVMSPDHPDPASGSVEVAPTALTPGVALNRSDSRVKKASASSPFG